MLGLQYLRNSGAKKLNFANKLHMAAAQTA